MSNDISKLTKIPILEPAFPNRSTAIINGESSGILNWDDIPYPSFYRAYKEMVNNFWVPDTVDMKGDAKMYPNLSQDERNAFDESIGLLASLDAPQTRFIMNVAEVLTDPAAQTISAVIAQQEAVHNESYSYVFSSITTREQQNKVFDIARTNPTIVARNEPIMQAYQHFLTERTPDALVKALIQSSILEGINFYNGFAFFYSLARKNKMTGTGKMISYINRDELAHSKFISELLRAILGENPALNNDALTEYLHISFNNAVKLESDRVMDSIAKVYDPEEALSFSKHRAHKMGVMLGCDDIFPDYKDNTMPWINAFVDNMTNTKTDFFEQRNTSYQKTDSDNNLDDL